MTAVLDGDGLSHKGNITKKAVVIRFEEGYSFGVCAYEEAFPQEMTYVQSGYTGFNSAAQQRAGAAFRLARAVDAADGGIEWYAEDNSLIAGVDVPVSYTHLAVSKRQLPTRHQCMTYCLPHRRSSCANLAER